MSEHEVLDVDFFLLIAGPGEVELGEGAIGLEGFDFRLIEVIGGAVGVAEEEPVAAFCAGYLAVFEEGAEGGDAGARADHDEGGVRVFGEAEAFVDVDEGARAGVRSEAVREVGGADAAAFAAV